MTLLSLGLLTGASAQGLDGPTAASNAEQTLTFTSTLTAVGHAGRGETTLPIPAGLTPLLLTGQITGVSTGSGTVTVAVGSVATSVSLRSGGAISLVLTPDMVINSSITVTLTNDINPNVGETCSADSTSIATFADISVLTTGSEDAPSTVAGFFAPSVTSITVVSADVANPLVNEAVLAAVGSLSSRFDRNTMISASTLPEFVPKIGAGARTVMIEANNEKTVHADISSQFPATMTLSGPAKDLPLAAAALGSTRLGLAGSNAVTDLIQTGNAATQLSFSLADLGAAQPVLAGIGRMTYSTTLSQSRFGGPMRAHSVHLEGGTTPTPTGGIVNVSVLWNDQIVNSQIIANSDKWIVDLTIDSTLVKRDNTLEVRLDALPPGDFCDATAFPAELDINGAASIVTGFPGQSLTPGFERFPQTLGTRLPVTFGTGVVTPAMLEQAAQLVSALQQASVPQLSVTLVDFSTFINASYPGVVVGATPADSEALASPLRFAPWRSVDSSGTAFSVTVEGPFAALEAFTTRGRDLLMLGATDATTSTGSLETRLANAANAAPFGFFVLTGDLLVAEPGQPDLALNTSSLVPQDQVTSGVPIPIWIYIAAGVLILVIVFRLIALRKRKQRIKSGIAS
ncbi:hypothetical protein [Alpinimonas psychrophila]|uniref:Cellulose synthase regulatory subunit n=1 Tax=Alpinimonas psychrophila TaxID=748908 RepID=A0A7W3JV06_9MICO|nr:hypothetical protein [Alpinimonas psychrophila]MBA8829718.1 hypothetical protein [Alpinimonas psychrophila]